MARNRLVPGDVREVFDPGFRAELPQSCESAAAELCPNVERSDGRMFACLYAYSRKVSAACQADARAVVTAK